VRVRLAGELWHRERLLADRDENGPFRAGPEKLVYPFGTRHSSVVDELDDERNELAGLSEKPSDGLEPSTPPYHAPDRQLVATGRNGLGLLKPSSGRHHLPPVATGCDRSAPLVLHARASMKATHGGA